MKKYLMMGAAVLAMSSAFVSCSSDKDLYDPNGKVNLVIDNYNKLFVETFGQPAANQNWGFGATPTSARATRAIASSFNFPSDADASKFLANVPEGVGQITANAGSVNGWIDPTWGGEFNIWGAWDGSKTSGGTIYLKNGKYDFSSIKFYIGPNTEVYLLEGAELTLGKANARDLQSGCNYYIAPKAKIIALDELFLNNGVHIYNHGTIEAPKLQTNSNSLLYNGNGGTVTIEGKISVENDLSVVVNDGTITAADLNTAGSGKFQNNADVTISGTTFVNSNNNTWVNNSQYHTGNFIYNAASDDVINNCHLLVDEDFNINLGDNPGNGNFKMDAGSSVETKNFNGGGNWGKEYSTGYNNAYGGPFYIYMGPGSVFKVSETATMHATKANYGIYCTGGTYDGVSYAVFQAKDIVAGNPGQQGYEVTYGGNIYVVAETHFAQGYSGSYPYIDFKEGASINNIYANGFAAGKPTVTIKTTTCNPGFQGGGGGGGNIPNIVGLHVMAEDLTAEDPGDLDFNDVVIDVIRENATQVTIRLQAAGGTLPLRINGDDDWEVHTLFDVDTKCMVNTGTRYHRARSPYSQTEYLDPVELTLDIANVNWGNMESGVNKSAWSDDQDTFAEQVRGIKLEVSYDGGNTWTELLAKVGQAASKVATQLNPYVDGWYQHQNCNYNNQWPWEKQNIGNGFADWVINPSASWYSVSD